MRKHNRIRNKLQLVSNQSHLNMIEKIQLVQIWKRFDFFQYKMENKGNINYIFELQEITVALDQKHFSISLLSTKKSKPLGENALSFSTNLPFQFPFPSWHSCQVEPMPWLPPSCFSHVFYIHFQCFSLTMCLYKSSPHQPSNSNSCTFPSMMDAPKQWSSWYYEINSLFTYTFLIVLISCYLLL